MTTEIKVIGLTKCNNCRYKARIDGNEDYGRICVENNGLAFLRSDKEDGYIATWHVDDPIVEGTLGRKVTDFEIVPRDPEIYEDWQVGDVICGIDDEGEVDTVSGEDDMCRVIFRSGELVAIADNYAEADINGVYTCSQLYREGWRLVLTDIEQRIIEEKKEYKPQDGDIVAWKDKKDDGDVAITIYRGNHRGYFTLFASGKSMGDNKYDSTLGINIFRPATEDEKQRLFDAMANEGKRWNAEKKVVVDIPKPYEFKKGEPVLVRDSEGQNWRIATFIRKYMDFFFVNTGISVLQWQKCIPYNEETMHLLGTSEDYEEE